MLNKRKSARSTLDKDRGRVQAEEDEGEEETKSLENAAFVLLPDTGTKRDRKKNVQEIMQKSNFRFPHEWRFCVARLNQSFFLCVVPKRKQVSWSGFTQHLHTNAIRLANVVRPKVINLIKALRFSAFIALCFEYKGKWQWSLQRKKKYIIPLITFTKKNIIQANSS